VAFPQALGFVQTFPTKATFNIQLFSGTMDLAALAEDSSNNILAVKILRSQAVPGALNGGNTIVFGPNDVVTHQPVTVNNLPAGFNLTVPSVFQTQNGLSLEIGFNASNQFLVVPAASTQPGDSYVIQSLASTPTSSSSVFASQMITNAAPVTLTLPAPWLYSGPQASAFPAFTFNYSGFNGNSNLFNQASLFWVTGGGGFSTIEVDATSSFQNGGTTVTIPDLTSISGFLATAPSGTIVRWTATILSGSQSLSDVASGRRPTSGQAVANSGTYTEP
jgi:hypothetical protein